MLFINYKNKNSRSVTKNSILFAQIWSKINEWHVLAVFAVLSTVPFWIWDLDLWSANFFYRPSNPDQLWPIANFRLWTLLYQIAPGITSIYLLGALSALALSLIRTRAHKLQRQATFVLLSIILGPGLLINGICKDHFGRPRPRQIEIFQGSVTYQPPGLPGEMGKSFPCGHCSLGFITWTLYFLNRRRRPKLAGLIFIFGCLFGILMGIGRMAAGAHFFSDVLWSGILTYFVCALIYLNLLAHWEIDSKQIIPPLWIFANWEDKSTFKKRFVFINLSILGGLLVGAALLATPYQVKQMRILPLICDAQGSLINLNISIAAGDVTIKFANDINNLKINWFFQGFGFPFSLIREQKQNDFKVQAFTLNTKGWFTELEGRVELIFPTQYVGPLNLEVATGKIMLGSTIPSHWILHAAQGVINTAARSN